MINAKIVADSKNEFGDRLTTMVITFPRIILAELNTHRMFSRNSASSRAIPFKKMIKSVEENPFVPIAWQKDHPGMQGTEYITDPNEIEREEYFWKADLNYLLQSARARNLRGVTKQLVNRQLETYMWHTVIVSSTEWENFFKQRCPKYEIKSILNMSLASFDPVSGSVAGSIGDVETRYYRSKKDLLREVRFGKTLTDLQWLEINEGQAEIHMMALAEAMWDAYNESTPKQLKAGEWHIPFENEIDSKQVSELYLGPDDLVRQMEWDVRAHVKIATTMAARTSYTVVGEDQKPMTYGKMLELHDKLKAQDPRHESPFEHCAPAMTREEFMFYTHTRPGHADPVQADLGREVEIMNRVDGKEDRPYTMERGWCDNFRGFVPYRRLLRNGQAH